MPVLIAGHPVTSGDVVIADEDGVVVVPKARLKEVLGKLPRIREAEAKADQTVREGARVPGFLKS
jgi:regulator of RNase E activity RraA